MSKKSGDVPSPDLETTGLEDETIASNQEGVPVPFIIGERKIAVRWISRPRMTRIEDIPPEYSGKK